MSDSKHIEQEEQRHLAVIRERLRSAIDELDRRVDGYQREIEEQTEHMWDARRDMDHLEKIAARESIQQTGLTGQAAEAGRQRLHRLLGTPYFGRFDFHSEGRDQAYAVYVGTHQFFDEKDRRNAIHDWRAPISNLFYDHEVGAARYDAPEGEIRGRLTRKRQFRIRDGRMEYVLESAVNIMDDVLQQELSRTSDEHMRNIVATIQRDQNAIIRNEHTSVLIIQGVAGSGKTSIALHRIAFLLYRFRDALKSSDILIISPNRVFSDYISNVLPELGEEAVDQIGMEALADELLEGKFRFQTFFEQTAALLEADDEALRGRIAYKASPDFLFKLNAYAARVETNSFRPEDLWVGRRIVPAWFIQEAWDKQRGRPVAERLAHVAYAVEQSVGIHYNLDVTPELRREIKATLRKTYSRPGLRECYKGFFEWIGQPELFRPLRGTVLEYADVFPMIHLKMQLEGVISERRAVKHLLIDEMQDYTPVQYAVIARLFPCRKTILGDANQAVSPVGSSTAESIAQTFVQASCVKLCKSYRSTFEITQFAQGIARNPDLQAVERHGKPPRIWQCRSANDELTRIGQLIADFGVSGYRSAGIICKTQKQAGKLHAALQDRGIQARLLSGSSASFTAGVIVCTAYLAKGLEFDQVIVPDVTDDHYATAMDRSQLYVACTRAMHELDLTHSGRPSRLLPGQPQPEDAGHTINQAGDDGPPTDLS